MMKKKGSLNLSIEAIVIVVIAFVVLGLGLGFVRGQFKSITETSTGVQEQIRQQILEDLRTGDKKLSFPVTTLTIERGEAQDIAIGVKNVGDLPLNFRIEVSTKEQQGTEATPQELETRVVYFLDRGPFTLSPTEAEAYNIKILAQGNSGTYLVNLKIIDEAKPTEPYAEKSFFVNIV